MATRIMVINDTPDLLDLFRELRETEGYEVILYSFAPFELAEIERLQPDLIVLDFIIGQANAGWQLLQMLKMRRATAAIPVVICTAQTHFVRQIEGYLATHDIRVVAKPFDIDELLTTIKLVFTEESHIARHRRIAPHATRRVMGRVEWIQQGTAPQTAPTSSRELPRTILAHLTCYARFRRETTYAPDVVLVGFSKEHAQHELMKRRTKGCAMQRVSRRSVVKGLAGLSLAFGGAGCALPFGGNTSTPAPHAPPPRTSLPPVIYREHTDAVNAVSWSPDGSRIASASDDHTVHLWDAASGRTTLAYRGHTSRVWGVAWSPDGRHIASASGDKTAHVWEAATGKLTLTFRGHSRDVNDLAWSPDGMLIASGSDDHTLQVWEVATGRPVFTYDRYLRYVSAVRWSPNGARIASSSGDYSAHAWDATTGAHPIAYTNHTREVYSVCWSPDSIHVVSGSQDATAQVWDGATGATVLTYSGHSDAVYAVGWSPSGSRIVSGSQDQTAQIWDAASGRLIFTYRGHATTTQTPDHLPTGLVHCLAWSPDGARIASASLDHTIHMWSAP